MAKSIGRFLCVFLLISIVSGAFAQKDKSFLCPDYIVRTMMEKYHCCPRPVNEQFTNEVLSDFLNTLDKGHVIFTAADIKEIQSYRLLLDQELAGKDQQFIHKVTKLYQARLKKADSTIKSTLQKPFDFSVAETLVFSNDSSDYPVSEQDYKNRWNKWLKYEVLSELAEDAEEDSVDFNVAYTKAHEAAKRGKVLKSEERRINRILDHEGGYENYITTLFCSKIAGAYDPHSDFYPVNEKEDFTNELSNQELSYGIELNSNDNGEVEIAYVDPGSPAWKSGELNKSDVLVSVKWENGKVVDLSGADAKEVSRIVGDISHKTMELKVRKANGKERTVKLQKQLVEREEDFVKSFILDGKQRIGYILLPGFYSDWHSGKGLSCANDVAKEIMKLRKENIEGLILDLSDNGGGYVDEAMQLAGIFISEGTMGIAKVNTGKTANLKDPNRGTIYDGPLLVMVNGSSASASEFVAGALQDYNRAIIAGSPTFGKATMQAILPCDTTLQLEDRDSKKLDNWDKDFVRTTIGKIYRPSGRTNQFAGVIPDVYLPEIAESFPYRENTMKYALVADTVKRSGYYTPLQPLPVKELAAKSQARLSRDSSFMAVKKTGTLLKKLYDERKHSAPLQADAYYKMTKEYDRVLEGMDLLAATDSNALFTVKNNEYDTRIIAVNEIAAEVNNNSIENINTNIYIHESFCILADYIQLLNKK